MAETAIEWATHSWNPTTGCDKVTRGCRNCYALRMAGRAKLMGNARYQLDGDPKSSGPGFGVQMWEDRLLEPARWRKPRVVFVDSMSDLFHPEVTDAFIARVFDAMAAASRHTFLVLTKRPERMRDAVTSMYLMQRMNAGLRYAGPPPNIWLGTSIENRHVVKRADHLRATPAARRFISAEPLLGPLVRPTGTVSWRFDVEGLNLEGIDWLIVGGESGPGAAPMDPAWAQDLRDECVASICPLCAGAVDIGAWHCPRCAGTGQETVFFFKQWGAWGPTKPERKKPPLVRRFEDSLNSVWRSNKKHQGRVLDGCTWDERPPLAHEVLDTLAARARTTPDQLDAPRGVRIDRRQP